MNRLSRFFYAKAFGWLWLWYWLSLISPGLEWLNWLIGAGFFVVICTVAALVDGD